MEKIDPVIKSEDLFEGRKVISSTFESDRFKTDRTVLIKMRQHVVKMLDEREDFIEQLKCPATNDRGSLGSSASLELVSHRFLKMGQSRPFCLIFVLFTMQRQIYGSSCDHK